MTDSLSEQYLHALQKRLEILYPDKSREIRESLLGIIENHGFPRRDERTMDWTEKDSLLITYGDSILKKGEAPLHTLHRFLKTRLKQSVSGVHILPFFPFSSDDGFSVIDYREVRNDLGNWNDIEHIADDYELMADLVINHVSSKSAWFRNYQKGSYPGTGYFIEEDPDADLSEVIRPRRTPLLTPVETDNGLKYVWTTFSADQVDLDFRNPEVLYEFADIILGYINHGISVIRLDAVAYLWKQTGTNCIHLPETHELIKLLRDLINEVAPHVTIITETNVPHKENISYFGEGDEAHMIYQFSLPPLVLHALLSENAAYLTQWAQELKPAPEHCYFFNFLASHDGIGVRPLEGLVPDEEFQELTETISEKGGLISTKTNSDGSESPYELNITFFSALADSEDSGSEHQIQRFLTAYTIMMSLQGVPGIYIHSFTASENDLEGVKQKGYNRAINRRHWDFDTLDEILNDPDSPSSLIFNELKSRLDNRAEYDAFHPRAPQTIHHCNDELFVVERTSLKEDYRILCVHNVSANNQKVDLPDFEEFSESYTVHELLGDEPESVEGPVRLGPYESKWLLIRD